MSADVIDHPVWARQKSEAEAAGIDPEQYALARQVARMIHDGASQAELDAFTARARATLREVWPAT